MLADPLSSNSTIGSVRPPKSTPMKIIQTSNYQRAKYASSDLVRTPFHLLQRGSGPLLAVWQHVSGSLTSYKRRLPFSEMRLTVAVRLIAPEITEDTIKGRLLFRSTATAIATCSGRVSMKAKMTRLHSITQDHCQLWGNGGVSRPSISQTRGYAEVCVRHFRIFWELQFPTNTSNQRAVFLTSNSL